MAATGRPWAASQGGDYGALHVGRNETTDRDRAGQGPHGARRAGRGYRDVQKLGLWARIRAERALDPRRDRTRGLAPEVRAAQLVVSLCCDGVSLADAERHQADNQAFYTLAALAYNVLTALKLIGTARRPSRLARAHAHRAPADPAGQTLASRPRPGPAPVLSGRSSDLVVAVARTPHARLNWPLPRRCSNSAACWRRTICAKRSSPRSTPTSPRAACSCAPAR